MPPAAAQAAIDREVAKRSPERLLVFQNATQQVWRWPETRPSGGTQARTPRVSDRLIPNEDLVQRIARIAFSLEEQEVLTLADVRARVRLSLSAERVTKRFYDAFRISARRSPGRHRGDRGRRGPELVRVAAHEPVDVHLLHPDEGFHRR